MFQFFKFDDLAKFYLFSLIVSLFPFLFIILFIMPMQSKIFVLMAFYWNLSLVTPKLYSRAMSHRYRFSIIKIIFKIDNILNQIIPKNSNVFIKLLIRSMSPLIFNLLLLLLFGGRGEIIYSLIGSLFFEVSYFVWRICRARLFKKF